LYCKHEDISPNRYKAISMWGIDKSKKDFSADIFDNFHGHRVFAGAREENGTIILLHKDTIPGKPVRFQRFSYTKLADDRFKMAYELSKDGSNWILGDSLIFVKTKLPVKDE